MRRIEVKTIRAIHSNDGRVKLTGNELRMARRPGPDSADKTTGVSGESTVYKYVVRVVAIPSGWRGTEELQNSVWTWDIENVITFAQFEKNEPIWEKLRGGTFYVNLGA